MHSSHIKCFLLWFLKFLENQLLPVIVQTGTDPTEKEASYECVHFIIIIGVQKKQHVDLHSSFVRWFILVVFQVIIYDKYK